MFIKGIRRNYDKVAADDSIADEDKIDAFLCAFGLFLVYKNLASELYFGDTKKGLIFLPLKQ